MDKRLLPLLEQIFQANIEIEYQQARKAVLLNTMNHLFPPGFGCYITEPIQDEKERDQHKWRCVFMVELNNTAQPFGVRVYHDFDKPGLVFDEIPPLKDQ